MEELLVWNRAEAVMVASSCKETVSQNFLCEQLFRWVTKYSILASEWEIRVYYFKIDMHLPLPRKSSFKSLIEIRLFPLLLKSQDQALKALAFVRILMCQ